MASTSLPLATAAAVATLFAAPAGAAPQDTPTVPPTVPPTPAPQQPGSDVPTSETPAPKADNTPTPAPSQTPNPSPSQPGVTTPDPNQAPPKPQSPTQPGVTTPRIAPLPVPGQQGGDMPAVMPDQPGVQQPKQPGTQPQQPGGTQPQQPGQAKPQQPSGDANNAQPKPPADTLVQPPQQPRWQSPHLEAAPQAPVVEMTGPHLEIGANVDGGAVLPGFVANTHHFSNKDGYVGTVGYHTPTGQGEAGISVEFVDINTVKVTSYTGGEGLADSKNTTVIDTTQANIAKAAVEHWIESQPGGAAALEAARHAVPPVLPPGDIAPQTADVGGVTTQWGGSLQY
ncbi:hypothetical protein [Nocardia arthritidis]|uniref:Uncharacterized protein n=1 Tax=Nocardia arthritidis TaxID=228602 RepID=A0A6G9Y7N5_9NOCA|nr:hypothetical protein [Nocardia arthritidis]QIS09221.1 hypothetical protein F5544_06550 [Nocardia arthritidis]